MRMLSKTSLLALPLAAVMLLPSVQAHAQWGGHRDYRGGHDYRGRGGIGPGGFIAGALLGVGAAAILAPRVYAPAPPVYYAPPPVLYAAPPVYYAAPPQPYYYRPY